jgi:hypothetical protein
VHGGNPYQLAVEISVEKVNAISFVESLSFLTCASSQTYHHRTFSKNIALSEWMSCVVRLTKLPLYGK